jgi:hypothetical protein
MTKHEEVCRRPRFAMLRRSFLTIPLSDAALDPSVDFFLNPANPCQRQAARGEETALPSQGG